MLIRWPLPKLGAIHKNFPLVLENTGRFGHQFARILPESLTTRGGGSCSTRNKVVVQLKTFIDRAHTLAILLTVE